VKAGIAFIRGMRMFGSKNYTKAEVIDALKDIGGEDLRILDVYNGDIVVFMKGDIHYATVGSKIEKCLEKHFGGRFYVTTRAFSTVKNMIRDVKGKIRDDP